jgi:transposase
MDLIQDRLLTTGWFILLSNEIDNSQTAYDMYRKKDVVEKAFLKFKRHLNMRRFKVHNDLRMENKVFIAFISLILYCYIDEIMSKNKLYQNMTLNQMLDMLSTVESFESKGLRFVRALNNKHKSIFKIFKIKCPISDGKLDIFNDKV